MIDSGDLANRFSYHAPKDEPTKDKHAFLRNILYRAAEQINFNVPDGREKSLAITHLEEAMFWANAAIARS